MKRSLNLKLPVPSWKSVLVETLFLTLYALFVLFMFQPFGTHEYTHPYKSAQLSGYGLIMLVFYPLAKKALLLFKKGPYFLKDEMRVLFISFLILILISFFYHAWAILGVVIWKNLPRFMYFGAAVLVIPYAALLYRAVLKAQRTGPEIPGAAARLEIRGASVHEHFYFKASDVFYLKSSGNYVMIYFQKDGDLKHEMVRATFSQVSAQLPSADFTPIHRSFMVNVKKFDRLLREEGKHILVSRQFGIRLPVSRHKVGFMEQKLKDHS